MSPSLKRTILFLTVALAAALGVRMYMTRLANTGDTASEMENDANKNATDFDESVDAGGDDGVTVESMSDGDDAGDVEIDETDMDAPKDAQQPNGSEGDEAPVTDIDGAAATSGAD